MLIWLLNIREALGILLDEDESPDEYSNDEE